MPSGTTRAPAPPARQPTASATSSSPSSRSGAYVLSGGTDGSVCVAETDGDSYWLGTARGAGDKRERAALL